MCAGLAIKRAWYFILRKMSAERLLPRVIYAYQVNRVHFRFFCLCQRFVTWRHAIRWSRLTVSDSTHTHTLSHVVQHVCFSWSLSDTASVSPMEWCAETVTAPTATTMQSMKRSASRRLWLGMLPCSRLRIKFSKWISVSVHWRTSTEAVRINEPLNETKQPSGKPRT